jgi:ring-1,2-phenylacetyl-CoA epoxidase subunit PaaE
MLDGDAESVNVRVGQSILDAAIRANMGAPYSCQSGICTACRAKLVAGHVVMDESDGLSEEELAEGYILTCQAKCTTPEVSISYDE